MAKQKKEFGVYHWDTFDNETIMLEEFDELSAAEEYVADKYKGRIGPQGADKVDIVNSNGKIVAQYAVR